MTVQNTAAQEKRIEYQKKLYAAILLDHPHFYDLPFPDRMKIWNEYRMKLNNERSLF